MFTRRRLLPVSPASAPMTAMWFLPQHSRLVRPDTVTFVSICRPFASRPGPSANATETSNRRSNSMRCPGPSIRASGRPTSPLRRWSHVRESNPAVGRGHSISTETSSILSVIGTMRIASSRRSPAGPHKCRSHWRSATRGAGNSSMHSRCRRNSALPPNAAHRVRCRSSWVAPAPERPTRSRPCSRCCSTAPRARVRMLCASRSLPPPARPQPAWGRASPAGPPNSDRCPEQSR
ncbi:unannotated protein [freshwater metagenome]|uniref:Unannotated protein n=1 Tax=freshwater metagenome TaxID=449393 RepID=A0A6J6I7S8_9ZZZZ